MRGAYAVLLVVSSCALVVDLDGLRGGTTDGGSDAADPLLVRCKGTASCVTPTTCCATCTNDDAGGCPYTFACVQDVSSCNGVPIGCSDQASCPSSQVCCAEVGPGNTYLVSTSCKTLAECTASAPSMILCDPNANAPCSNGAQCSVGSSGSFADLYECQ